MHAVSDCGCMRQLPTCIQIAWAFRWNLPPPSPPLPKQACPGSGTRPIRHALQNSCPADILVPANSTRALSTSEDGEPELVQAVVKPGEPSAYPSAVLVQAALGSGCNRRRAASGPPAEAAGLLKPWCRFPCICKNSKEGRKEDRKLTPCIPTLHPHPPRRLSPQTALWLASWPATSTSPPSLTPACWPSSATTKTCGGARAPAASWASSASRRGGGAVARCLGTRELDTLRTERGWMSCALCLA